MGFSYCIVLPSLCGTQDFLRVVDDRVASVSIEVDRSILYAKHGCFPEEGRRFDDYCWSNTVTSEQTSKNHALYMCYTILPSTSGGLVPENVHDMGIYVTVSEEIVRGHTGEYGEVGSYFEWVLPAVAGTTEHQNQTFYLPVRATLVLPSTFVVRFGSHPKEETVVFVHAIRVSLPQERQVVS